MVIRQSTVENMGVNRQFWAGRRVFLTGHTGFKGGWLSLWLQDMGAQVHGYALAPATRPNFFSACAMEKQLESSTIADVRDGATLAAALRSAAPDIVIHLAAQPLVRQSYAEPEATYATNVMGTVNLLEAVRQTSSVKAVVNVTTDKCYENREWHWAYRENDALGGHDPYASSKACSELVTAAYRSSFLEQAGIQLASARAGNVIGGGDWSADRLIPDFFRAHAAGEPFVIRSPQATRPWQHVLEPLAGYLKLAEKLYEEGAEYATAWNFGPEEGDVRPVAWLADYLCEKVPGASWRHDGSPQPHEAGRLKLDSAMAKAHLGWHPEWPLKQSLNATVEWYLAQQQDHADMAALSLAQIHAYEQAAGGK